MTCGETQDEILPLGVARRRIRARMTLHKIAEANEAALQQKRYIRAAWDPLRLVLSVSTHCIGKGSWPSRNNSRELVAHR